MHQTYPSEGIENDTCTASRIRPPEDLALLPAGYSGGIWTNRIEVIAPLTGVSR